ncbi:signal transduction histidine-protein kinase/phosphatase UhpB [Photobacterium sp. J15]|uniref:signal transduction histidine-protein kinase/phosphatase UhpB n=1 Tax=Photobacterium sp. J15 TaxID=265901 RepID=UPI0007E44306|nr:signal transduction histidine-protein kinase/phosphatase UhpB [Photobacterium sp. J15]
MTTENQISGNCFSYAFASVLFTISWFCLWSISNYLSPDLLLAALFLPAGLKLAVQVLTPRRFWLLFLGCELTISGWLLSILDSQPHDQLLFLTPFIGYFLILPFSGVWQQLKTYWQRLLALIGLVLVHGMAIGLITMLLSKPMSLPAGYVFSATITAITGGILLVPFCYLLYDYLNKTWLPLTPTLIHQEITIRPSALLWSIGFFTIGLIAELTFLEQLEPLVLLIMLLPNIFMAYRYGWQGGVLAAVMNSILLTSARQLSGAFSSDMELKVFITTQALVGLGLGIAISRQYLLAQQLQMVNSELARELDNKQQLARQLVKVEEDIRKSVARELHDEIGQNITAIQIQAMLADRTTQEDNTKNIAEAIHSLSMRIHRSTRQLLTQLRPQILDELGLENALRQLAQEMKFAERQIDFQLNIGIANHKLDDITAVTLYRIIQELLNNVSKHANATSVHLSLMPGSTFSLELRDNGCGLPQDWRSKGQGLRGIEERVSALGGSFSIQSGNGTRFIVNLPTKIPSSEGN